MYFGLYRLAADLLPLTPVRRYDCPRVRALARCLGGMTEAELCAPVPWLPLWGSCRRSRRRGDPARTPSAPSGGTSPTGGGVWVDLPPWGSACWIRRLASVHRTTNRHAQRRATAIKTGGSHNRRPTGGVLLCAKPIRCNGLQIRKPLRTQPEKPTAPNGVLRGLPLSGLLVTFLP